jgi:di/tricarboxylate transporter
MSTADEAPAWQAGTTIALILCAFVLMALEVAPPDMIMIGALTLFVLTGIISTSEATSGFAQSGLLTVMVLFVVTTGLERTGAFEPVRKMIIPKRGTHTSLPEILARFVLPVSVISAFLNNTPVVGLLISTVSDMAIQTGLPPSKLLIPLSQAAIFGGTCTLIGTSTNLVLVSLAQRAMLEETGEPFSFGFFEIGRVGLPVLFAGFLFIFAFSGLLLPSRDAEARKLTPSRVYKLTAVVSHDSAVVGKTVEHVGLDSIEGCTLIEIVRGEQAIAEVSPSETLRADDILVFAGQVDGITQLMRAPRKRIRKLLEVEQRANRPSVASKPSEGAPPLLPDQSITVFGADSASSSRFGLAPLWQRLAYVSPGWLRPSPVPKLVEVWLAPGSRVLGFKSRAFNEAFESTVVAIARDDVRTSSMVGSVASHYGIDGNYPPS